MLGLIFASFLLLPAPALAQSGSQSIAHFFSDLFEEPLRPLHHLARAGVSGQERATEDPGICGGSQSGSWESSSDIGEYHDVVLLNSMLPLEILQEQVQEHIRGELKRRRLCHVDTVRGGGLHDVRAHRRPCSGPTECMKGGTFDAGSSLLGKERQRLNAIALWSPRSVGVVEKNPFQQPIVRKDERMGVCRR